MSWPDGLPELQKTETWKLLMEAQSAVYMLALAWQTENKKLNINPLYEARLKLTQVENILRHEYKRMDKESQ